jgi:predicted nucleic acid-binding protein
MPQIFVDTWAWCAIVNRRDAAHKGAEELNKELLEGRYIFVTTNFILDETYTLIRARIGYQAAVDFGDKIKRLRELGLLKIIRIDQEVEEAAWELFVKYKDMKALSFTDCTSFIVMHQLDLQEVFTDDEHFHYPGFIKRSSPSKLGK